MLPHPSQRRNGRDPQTVGGAAVRKEMVCSGVHSDVIDALLGHAGQGSGGVYYTARGALWVSLENAVEKLPKTRLQSPLFLHKIRRSLGAVGGGGGNL